MQLGSGRTTRTPIEERGGKGIQDKPTPEIMRPRHSSFDAATATSLPVVGCVDVTVPGHTSSMD